MKKNKGSALTQYAIVLAVLTVALVPIFYTFGHTIVEHFTYFYETLKGDDAQTFASNNNSGNTNNNNTNTTNNTSSQGDDDTFSGPSQEDPQVSCSGDSCIIDFGDYALEGLPSDLGDYISSTGTSGGTESLAAVLEELAEKADVDQQTKDLIKMLAELGHEMSYMQEQTEKAANEVSISGSNTLLWDPEVFVEIKPGEGIIADNFTDVYNSVKTNFTNPDNIQDENVKAIVEVLADEIIAMNTDFVSQCETINQQIEEFDKSNTSNQQDFNNMGLYYLLHPSTSERTDVDSTIICKTGKGHDTGDSCN